ncbi:MAG: hypothetical protein M0003_05150 [Acidithiobacillus sp.]|nr:hypothetical protein [Acidithiobacillus sp.]
MGIRVRAQYPVAGEPLAGEGKLAAPPGAGVARTRTGSHAFGGEGGSADGGPETAIGFGRPILTVFPSSIV